MRFAAQVYHQLMDHYGPQGWWPLYHTAHPPAYSLGDHARPKNDHQRFEIALGAILTQNTAWSNVLLALDRLSAQGVLSLDVLLSLERDHLAHLIRPVGYFNQKATYVQNLCRFLKQTSFAQLATMAQLEARSALLSVKGIGEETADCILLYAVKHLFFVVDAYTRRVFLNLEVSQANSSYLAFAKWIEDQLPKDVRVYQEFHGLLVLHGKLTYSKKPYPKLDPLLAPR